ncbi:DNA gyrase inhibitor YacG [Desulfurobacterium atlanticum]|uniref:DNA gyrase inhibitor YacG n=1 Tax=Desulfurobacterium atlanticum TaxID=240169 RepID=A0A238YHC3_9BACT|nr:DNA gyrase inhibitor YacG [Desulfurobacterium atlanticum]SNR70656.1 hypothetical protein SAMN06265340_103163 [Desulfurobacterium atlanticum]
MAEKRIKCPVCKKETNWENNPYRPFCSEKCKLADLHKWLNEEYSIQENSAIATNQEEKN